MTATVQLPGQPPILEGFLNLRGTIVPQLIFRRLLGLPGIPPEQYTPVIVLKTRGQTLALVVDRVLEVETSDRSQMTPLAEGHSLNHFADGYVPGSPNGFTLLNVDRLLLSEERKRLDELSAEARRRVEEIEASRK
jgi:purine-binding chemotaxis protein CheW